MSLQTAFFLDDLHWVLTSPGLLNTNSSDVWTLPASVPELQFSADQLAALEMRVLRDCHTHRVGHYYESLIRFVLESCLGFEVLAYRQQIQQGTRTIGEIDFVFREPCGKITHLEVAIKFFLRLGDNTTYGPATDQSAEFRLVGPNPADNLGNKLQRLRSRQLPLGKMLHQCIDRHQIWMQGCIHHPFGSTQPQDCEEQLNPEHLRGFWIRFDADPDRMLKTLRDLMHEAGLGSYFYIMRKPHWLSLSPVSLTTEEDILHENELLSFLTRHFAQSNHSVALGIRSDAAHCQQTMRTHLSEQQDQRLFIVAQDWPN